MPVLPHFTDVAKLRGLGIAHLLMAFGRKEPHDAQTTEGATYGLLLLRKYGETI